MILTCVRTVSFQIWLHHDSWCFSVFDAIATHSILLPHFISLCFRLCCVYGWDNIFFFWATNQYCSSVNIISFIRLIWLKRDENKGKKDERTGLLHCTLFIWDRQKKTPLSIHYRSDVYFRRSFFYSIRLYTACLISVLQRNFS